MLKISDFPIWNFRDFFIHGFDACCRIDKTTTENLHFIEDKIKKYYAIT